MSPESSATSGRRNFFRAPWRRPGEGRCATQHPLRTAPPAAAGRSASVVPGVRLDELVRQALDEFKEELRLTESTPVVHLPDAPLAIQGDAGLLLTGIRACVGAAIALFELSGKPADLHIAAFASGETLHCEFRQDAYVLDPPHLARLFDMESSERPGGRTIAVALAAATRVALLHGGSFDARPATSGGCVFVFDLPKTASGTIPVKAN